MLSRSRSNGQRALVGPALSQRLCLRPPIPLRTRSISHSRALQSSNDANENKSSWWAWLPLFSKSKSDPSQGKQEEAQTKSSPQDLPPKQSSSPTPPTPHPTRMSKTEMAERDRAIFEALDDREGGGAGNEIVDGQFEKGMTKNTRANQYRVI